MLAHIERYFGYQKRGMREELLNSGVLMQCNADFFLSWRTKRKALHMLREGEIHFVASDCHNMTSRPPTKLGEAMKVIGSKGAEALERNLRDWSERFSTRVGAGKMG